MTATPDNFANFVITTLTGGAGGVGTPLNTNDTTCTVATGSGAWFSTLPARITLGPAVHGSEIAIVTAISSDTLTLTRGQEGTSKGTWPVGTLVQQSATAYHFNNLWTYIKNLQVNVMDYGAVGDNATDNTTAINNAITAASSGGIVYFPAGTFLYSSPLALSTAGVHLIGAGEGATFLKPSGTWSGANMVTISANHCGVRDITFVGTSSSSSASSTAANTIEVSAARYATLRNLDFQYINGWCIEVAATSGAAPYGAMLDSIHCYHTAKGIHLLGNTAQSFGVQAWLSNLNLEIVDTNEALLIEDANDVLISNLNGAAGQGTATNNMLHIKGACSSVYVTNPDIGVFPGGASAPVVLIESGTNGNPSGVGFSNGVIQKGTVAVSITSGAEITFNNIVFKANNGDGVDVSGLSGEASFTGCTFKTNGAGGGTCYDLNLTNSSNQVNVKNCVFESPIGSGANLITNAVNDTNHKGVFEGCHFAGSGNTPSNTFAGTPQIVRNSVGYNPRGSITVPTIGASPATISTSQNDVLIIFSNLGGLTAWSIAGTTVSQLPVVGVGYFIAARTSIVLTYTTTAPTMQWFAQ